ncbi:MAG: biotin/lipoate A/B protein ligase family protein [Desulfobacterales bacterium]
MELFNLGKVPWLESQLIYHALADLGREALSLVSPATPYVCIGFHQDAEQEVDLDFCKANNIPVFRRNLGGGAVYLDGNQLFFQLILQRDNSIIPQGKISFYKKFLQPVINVYRRIGIAAEYKPVNDVVVESRKISGTGAAEIAGCIVFVGNLIVDFDYDMMSRVLKVPDEKFRDKIQQTIKANLTTIRRELGDANTHPWPEGQLNDLMAEEFQKLIGPMQRSPKDLELQTKMDELKNAMLSNAAGGLIRADFEVINGYFGKVYISGDFFCYPDAGIESLESALDGRPVNQVGTFLKEFYTKNSIETPGVEIDDWLKILAVT